MTAHRIVNGDGYAECFACGTIVEIVSDGETFETFEYVECRPGGWSHPPYLMPGDPPHVETCAAHPYEPCQIDAVMSFIAAADAAERGEALRS